MVAGYDRETLYARLDEVADLAGELRYVDAVLAYIADQTQTPGAGPGPAHSYIEVNDIGRTYPFSRRIMRGPLTPDYAETVTNFCRQAAEEAATWRDTNLESLRQTIAPVTQPDTSHYDEIVERLKLSYMSLSNDPAEGDQRPSDDARAMLRNDFGLMSPDDWTGYAASNFRNIFYKPFQHEVRENQAAYTKSIAAGFVRAKAIDELAQIGLLEAVTATRGALLEQLRHRQQDTGATSTATALIISGLAVSILAPLVPGAGPLVAASMAAVSGGLSYAGSVEAEREAREEQRFEGRSADDLFFGLYDTASTIARRRRGHYDALDLDMGNLLEWASFNHRENLLIPKRPEIAERDRGDQVDPDIGEFRHDDFHRFT